MGVFSDYFRKQKQLRNFNGAGQLFDYLGYENGCFIMEGGAMSMTFFCQPTPGTNESIKNAFAANFKKSYPADTTIAAQLVALPSIQHFSQQFETTRGNRLLGVDNELTEEMARSLIEDLEKKVFTDMHSGARARDFEFWFTLRVPTMAQIPTDKELNSFHALCIDLEEMLNGAGFSPVRATPISLLLRLKILFNTSKKAAWRVNDSSIANDSLSFNEQVIEPGYTVNYTPSGVVIGRPESEDSEGMVTFEKDTETYIKILSLESLPEKIVYGQMMDLIGDWRSGKGAHGDPFMISTLIHYPEQSSAKSEISTSRGWLIGQAKGKVLEWFQGLADQKRDYDQLWREIAEEGEQIVHAGLHVITFSESKTRSDRTVAKMQRYFATKRITFTQESVLTGALLQQNIPGMLDAGYYNFRRHSIYSSKALPFLTPHMSNWKGNTNEPIVPLVTRMGQIFYWDLFKTDGGFNFLLNAATGKGKSVLINYIVNCYLNSGVISGGSLLRKPYQQDYQLNEFDDGAQVFILDSGRSYQNLAEMFEDSQFMTFGQDFKYSLNPFPAIDHWSGELGQGPQILTMFKAMAAPKHGVSETQRAEMMTMLTNMWDELGKKSTITEFVRRCHEHPESYMNDIGKQLAIFAEGGVYGHLFSDSKPPINFDGRLVVVEMEELSTDQHLQLVVILGIITQIQHRIFMGGTERKSLFLMEEAWQWMTGDKDGEKGALIEFVGEFLQAAFRKFRKVRASGGVISQSILDATQNAVGQALLANTDWKIFLGQDPSTIDKIKETNAFSATPHQFEQMKTVHTLKGSYSEMQIFYGGQSEICRLELEPETLMIFSTDPDDRELMKKYRQLGFSVREAATKSVREKNGL